MFITMSSSAAPSAIASRASSALTSGRLAPCGKPMTTDGTTSLPANSRAARATSVGRTHTLAMWYSFASLQAAMISSSVANGFRTAWSMVSATWVLVHMLCSFNAFRGRR